jgi:hypothetical protein
MPRSATRNTRRDDLKLHNDGWETEAIAKELQISSAWWNFSSKQTSMRRCAGSRSFSS